MTACGIKEEAQKILMDCYKNIFPFILLKLLYLFERCIIKMNFMTLLNIDSLAIYMRPLFQAYFREHANKCGPHFFDYSK